MKNKSWIIIVIMGIALTISTAYSIKVSKGAKSTGESTVTTTSIIEMTATTVTIKNTLTGVGTIEYKEKSMLNENINDENKNTIANEAENSDDNNSEKLDITETEKTYQIELAIEDKDLNKVKIGQDVEIAVKNDEKVMNYLGNVTKINKNANKSTINVEIANPNELIQENMTATCTVIIEKAENVVGLPVDAIQTNETNEKYVDVVQQDGNTTQVLITTGISDEYYVEITQGLRVGDRVQIVKSSTTVVNKNENKTSEK